MAYILDSIILYTLVSLGAAKLCLGALLTWADGTFGVSISARNTFPPGGIEPLRSLAVFKIFMMAVDAWYYMCILE